jgi:hypothetical protein
MNRRTIRQGVWLPFLFIVIGACNSSPAPGPSAHPAMSAAHPPDQLAPDELLESAEDGFGLPLPQGVHVVQRTPNAVIALGPVPSESVLKFVKARITGGQVERGTNETRFVHTTVTTPRAEFKGTLQIEVAEVQAGVSRITIFGSPEFNPQVPTMVVRSAAPSSAPPK